MFVKNSGDETGDETWKIQRDMKSKRIDFRRSLSRLVRGEWTVVGVSREQCNFRDEIWRIERRVEEIEICFVSYRLGLKFKEKEMKK